MGVLNFTFKQHLNSKMLHPGHFRSRFQTNSKCGKDFALNSGKIQGSLHFGRKFLPYSSEDQKKVFTAFSKRFCPGIRVNYFLFRLSVQALSFSVGHWILVGGTLKSWWRDTKSRWGTPTLDGETRPSRPPYNLSTAFRYKTTKLIICD